MPEVATRSERFDPADGPTKPRRRRPYRRAGPGEGPGRLHARGRAGRVAVVFAAAGVAWCTQFGAVVALGMAALLVGVLLVAQPQVGALAAVALIFSNAAVIAVNSMGAPQAVTYLLPMLLLLTIGYRVFARREPLVLPRPAIWVAAFFVAQILGSVASRDPVRSVATVQTFAIEGLLLFLLITNAIRGYRAVRMAALVLVVVAGALATLTLVQDAAQIPGNLGGFSTKSKTTVGKDQTGGVGEARHAGPIGEQNRWAQSLAMVLPIAGALAISDRSWGARATARMSFLAIAGGVVITYSRGAVVGLVLAGIIAVLVGWVRTRTAVLAGAALVLIIGTFAPVFATRAATVVSARPSVGNANASGASTDGSFSNRTVEAKAAISVFLHQPVVGVGIGLFPTYFQDEARKQGADRIVGVDREAHSLYLGLAAETGLLGLITFAGVAAAIIRPLAATRRRNRGHRDDVAGLATGFALAMVIYLTTAIFLHFAYIRYFWLLAALAAAMGMAQDLTNETDSDGSDPQPPLLAVSS